MILEIIKQKMMNGEGFVQMKNAGLIRVSEMNPSDDVIWQPTKNDYKLVNNELVLKTEQDYDDEEKKKIQQNLLNQFKPLIDAMTFQEISKSKGSNAENLIFSDTDIKNWGNYISEIATGNIDAIMPEIPEAYKKII